MGTNTGWRMAGMEVPLLSTDTFEWRQLSVPSSSSYSAANSSNQSLAKDFASSCAIGNPLLISPVAVEIGMSHFDVSRVKLQLIPMIQDLLLEWHIIHFFGTTPSESPGIEDFSYRLSSIQIDNNVDKRLWNGRLGKSDFSVAFVLLLSMRSSSGEETISFGFNRLPYPSSLIKLSRDFTSWIIWGRSGEDRFVFFSNFIALAASFLISNAKTRSEHLWIC